jgi:hypothetical protein
MSRRQGTERQRLRRSQRLLPTGRCRAVVLPQRRDGGNDRVISAEAGISVETPAIK